MTISPLYDRQARLAEVGERGQTRIEGTTARVDARAPGAEVEYIYLVRSGVGVAIVLPRPSPSAFEHAGWFRFAATRDVGDGAWRALRLIRRALGKGEP